MERFGIRKVVTVALLVIAAGAALSIFVTAVLDAGGHLGRADRPGQRVDGARVRGADRRPLVPQAQGPGDRHPDRRKRDRAADLPADRRDGRRERELADGVAHHRGHRARRRADHGDLPAQLARRPQHDAVRLARRRRAVAAAAQPDQPGQARHPGARAGGEDPHVLGAGRGVRHLRGDHQRAHRHPLHPERARPRDGGAGRGGPARGRRASSMSSAPSHPGT